MNILNEYKKDIFNVTNEIKRNKFEEYYESLKTNNILILGIRQIGKTTLAKQLLNEFINNNNIKNDEFVYFDIRNSVIKNNWTNILNSLKEDLKLVLIDEIQLIENWSNEIQSIIDRFPNTKFVITGSNSHLLKMNSLVGRAVQYILKPLEFNEYLKFWNNSFKNYLYFGSFPKRIESINIASQNSKLSEQVIKDVVREDIVKKINIDKFMSFSKNILNYIGSEVKTTSLPSSVNIENRTGKEYLYILIESGIINVISNGFKKNLNSNIKKLYFTDLGLISFFNSYREPDAQIDGKLAENAIFNYLDTIFNKEYDDHFIEYFKDKKEIDFVIHSKKLIIEVKYSSDKDYLKEGVENINDLAHKGYKRIIISKDINEKDIINNIEYISLEKFITNDYLKNNNLI